MALIKTPGGEFYLDNTQFQVDYDENSVTFIGEGGGTGPAATTTEAGLVRQATAVPDAEGATDTTLAATVNNLLAALRTAGILASD